MRSFVLGCCLSASLASASAAQAQGPQAAAPVITNPDWSLRPSSEQLWMAYPAKAMRENRSGEATIVCRVTPEGRLMDCRVDNESPAGEQFGAAALQLSQYFLMKPQTVDGKPVGGAEVRIPIRFRSPGRHVSSRGAPSTADDRRMVQRVAWEEAPSFADVAAAYPEKARTERLAGTVSLFCRLDGEGGLNNCRTVVQRPPDAGFEAAAKGLLKKFRSPLRFDDGSTVRGAYTTIVVTFSPRMLDPGEIVIGKPNWTAAPDGDQVAALYPPEAKAAKIGGRVVLNCRVGRGGRLEACDVPSEEPAGKGFAGAARGLAEHLRLSLWTDEGLPTVGGRVNVPLRFAPED